MIVACATGTSFDCAVLAEQQADRFASMAMGGGFTLTAASSIAAPESSPLPPQNSLSPSLS